MGRNTRSLETWRIEERATRVGAVVVYQQTLGKGTEMSVAWACRAKNYRARDPDWMRALRSLPPGFIDPKVARSEQFRQSECKARQPG